MQHVRPYFVLLKGFLEGRLTASHFETAYLHMFTNDRLLTHSREYEILNDLFFSVDAYCEDPGLRAETIDGISQDQLRAAAKQALQDLIPISGDQSKI